MVRFITGTNDFAQGKIGKVIRFGERKNHLDSGPKKGLKLFAAENDNEEVDLFIIQKKDGLVIKKSLSDAYVKSNPSENQNCFLTFTDGDSGIQTIEADSDLTYNPSTGTLTATEVSATTLDIGGTNLSATATELNYVDGVTSAIQTQMDTKASTGKAIAMAIVFG